MTGVVVMVTVDWEGRSLLAENLEAIGAFRARRPDLPLQHFLNPAYYTRGAGDPAGVTAAIRRVIRPGDELGLHVHAFRSLAEAASVTCRTEPLFIGETSGVPRAEDDWGFYPDEPGYDVPLEAYDVDELVRILATARDLLSDKGFGQARSFRAGGWMSGPRVQEALARVGFEFDCSAVDPQFVVRRFGPCPLSRWLTELWPAITPESQPFCAGPLIQIPNNAALMDYATAEEFLAFFERHGRAWLERPDRDRILVTGFHQETARVFLGRLDHGLTLIGERAARWGVPLRFAASPDGLCAMHD